jgi:hypothetical protein
MCAVDELHPYLFLFMHRTSKVFHIALPPLIVERISQVANTTIMTGAIIALLERWQAHSAGDSSLDIAEEMMHLPT